MTKPKSKRKQKVDDLLAAAIEIARDESRNHVDEDDGERCFNRYTFINELRNRLDYELDDCCGAFANDWEQVARFLYCCLCIEGSDKPDSPAFGGMTILD